MKHSQKQLTLVLLVGAIAFGLINVFLIPPFQNPDEIQHFMFTVEYAFTPKQLKQLDDQVLQLLKQYKWFHFIGVGPGWENIQQIKDIYFLNYFSHGKYSVGKTYFHFIYGKILKLSGIQNPLTAFYFLRVLSFVLYLAIFLCCVWFWQRYFPDYWVLMAIGQWLLFQPATILNSVNYDVMFTLLGVVFFMVAYHFLVSEKDTSLVVLAVLAALAVLIKKGGLLFFFYLILLMLFKSRRTIRLLRNIGFALLVSLVVFIWFNYLFPGRSFTLYTLMFSKYRSLFNLVDSDNNLLDFGFINSVWHSFYFYTGWMGFKLSTWWYVLLNAFMILSVAGIVVSLKAKRIGTPNLEKKWHLYALIVLVVQLLSIWLYYGSGLTAQGRYLFPILIPIITILYGGLVAIEKYFQMVRHYLLIALVVLLSFFWVAALVRIITVFYLEMPSPHKGL